MLFASPTPVWKHLFHVSPASEGPIMAARSARPATKRRSPAAVRCRRKFLEFYPGGFHDADYIALERDYKWQAHERWKASLSRDRFRTLLHNHRYAEIAKTAVGIESRTNLLFSFEKMALRDAVKTTAGARKFATGLYDFLFGAGADKARFERRRTAMGELPRRQTRVVTWPAITVFPFLARPDRYLFMKPRVTQKAAAAYGYGFEYHSRPEWPTYASYRAFAEQVRRDNRDLRPRDMIDLQSFIWVCGSDEYE